MKINARNSEVKIDLLILYYLLGVQKSSELFL